MTQLLIQLFLKKSDLKFPVFFMLYRYDFYFQCFQVRLFSTKDKVVEQKVTIDVEKEDEKTRTIGELPDLKNLPHFKYVKKIILCFTT